MWLSAIKLAVSAGSKIYANKQKTKIAMSDAQLMHASRMAEGKEAYQGKLLESRQSDWKDEFILLLLSSNWQDQLHKIPSLPDILLGILVLVSNLFRKMPMFRMKKVPVCLP